MTDKIIHNILLVDDEESILKALKRLLSSLDAKIYLTTDSSEALKLIQENEVSLIISDQRMPGMTGVELLNKTIDISPDTIRILLTGYADIDATIDAINSGAVKYYLNKPWDDEMLLGRVQESLDFYSVFKENKRLNELTIEQNKKLQEFNNTLEQKVDEQTSKIKMQNEELNKSFMETIKAFSSFIEMRYKDVGSHSQRVALLVKNMLKGFELQPVEYQDIIVASYLHDIGKISLSDKILRKKPKDYSPSDTDQINKHTTIGQTCVYNISGFGEIGVLIRNHHENYDGSGYPDNQTGDQISLGARIIKICNDFDHYAFQGSYPDAKMLNEATAKLVQFSGTLYDPDIVKKFIEMDVGKSLYHNENNITVAKQPDDLIEGMVVVDDIYTQNGMFLLPKGAKLSEGMIIRIRKINAVDAINGDIIVYKMKRNQNVPV